MALYYWLCDTCSARTGTQVSSQHAHATMDEAQADHSYQRYHTGHQISFVVDASEPVIASRFYWQCDTCTAYTGSSAVSHHWWETMDEAQADRSYLPRHAGHQLAYVHNSNVATYPNFNPAPEPYHPPEIISPYHPTLPMRENDEFSVDVVQLQLRLRRDGSDPGKIDGWFGPITAGAVQHFKAARELGDPAVVDEETWQALIASG